MGVLANKIRETSISKDGRVIPTQIWNPNEAIYFLKVIGVLLQIILLFEGQRSSAANEGFTLW